MKSVVVDRQSATIKIVKNGEVVRELPFRIISDDTIIVGDKILSGDPGDRIFSGPLPDLTRWERDEDERGGKKRRRRAELNGWDMKPWDRPTFSMPAPAKALRWALPGPLEELRKLRESLHRQIALAETDEESRELTDTLIELSSEEKERKEVARRQSVRKRPAKAERKKHRKPKPEQLPKPEAEESGKKDKKKGKNKKRRRDGKESNENKGSGQKSGRKK